MGVLYACVRGKAGNAVRVTFQAAAAVHGILIDTPNTAPAACVGAWNFTITPEQVEDSITDSLAATESPGTSCMQDLRPMLANRKSTHLGWLGGFGGLKYFSIWAKQ